MTNQPTTVSAPKKSFLTRLKSIRGQQIIVTIAFIAIPLFLLFLFTYLPFAKMIQFSLYDMKYLGRRHYVGLENYAAVFTRDDCFGALKNSAYYFAGAVFQICMALLLAAILAKRVKFGNFFKGAIFFPYLVCGIAIGFIFKFFLTHGFVLDTLLSAVGLQVDNLPYWLKDTSINNWVLAATSVWRYLGQNMVLFLGAMMSIDPTLYEAADIDGANAWHKFMHITLPGIKTVVLLNLILAITGSISSFDMPYVITDGNFGTQTYFIVMNHVAHVTQKVGLASAMAVVLLAIILVVTVAQKLIFWYFYTEDVNGLTPQDKRRAKKRAAKAEKEAATV